MRTACAPASAWTARRECLCLPQPALPLPLLLGLLPGALQPGRLPPLFPPHPPPAPPAGCGCSWTSPSSSPPSWSTTCRPAAQRAGRPRRVRCVASNASDLRHSATPGGAADTSSSSWQQQPAGRRPRALYHARRLPVPFCGAQLTSLLLYCRRLHTGALQRDPAGGCGWVWDVAGWLCRAR